MTARVSRLLETALIGLGLLSFWPWTLGYRALWYQIGLVVLMLMLAVLAWTRVRRVRDAFEQERETRARTQSGPNGKA
ncbi:MAG: hypothetical protein GWP08_17145 [Nitrospiraceae bacterium]|nr:hypothetical protein [Nitrospiraceae bacterium]